MSESLEKIKSINELSGIVADLKLAKKKVVLCHGVFDLIHPGHIRHLAAARQHGDVLVVTVTPDRFVNKGPGRPVFPEDLRAEVLASLNKVDFVAINQWPTAVETIQAVKPDIYVKGNDYQDSSKDITGRIVEEEEAIRKIGGRIVFTDEITFSSSSLANNFFNLYPAEAAAFLKDFRRRIKEEDIRTNLDSVSDCKILLIGDTIIDEYHYCSPMGKSPKENVIATKYLSEEVFAGGILAAANHLASLCNRVHLVTCLGERDSREEFVRSHLKPNVDAAIFFRPDSPTVVKRRFVEPNYTRKLFEVSFLDEDATPLPVHHPLCEYVKRIVLNYDAVLVGDFGHGLFGPDLINSICQQAKFLAINVQTNSANTGYNLITKYPRADYICIDAPEARLALQDRTSTLEEIIRTLTNRLNSQCMAVTQGNHGCLVYSRREGFFKIPALNRNVVDTVGAGDAFYSITSPCVASGMPMEQVGLLGNAAGALKVSIVGNRSAIEKVALLKFITALMK
ncbi:MAG: adenylyltransferase/cytidyltransferase family protein [Acidobacteria bacterium]|nr:adenylyltransferase/cytidyltransferase family protein [Acidobacteriota bacterium]